VSVTAGVTQCRCPVRRSACGLFSFSLRVHRGRVGDADDRALAGLQPSNGLSPRLGARIVEQGEALVLQLIGSDLEGVAVSNLELDARLGTGRSSGHWDVPKQARTAWVSGQTPKDLHPSTSSLCR
jgi:hypothetical protein